MRNNDGFYGAVAQVLHWTIFVLIVLQFVGAELVDAFPRGSAGRIAAVDMHESMGLAVLALIAIRLCWRLANPPPPGQGPEWQQRAARLAHAGLYVLMLAIPISGFVAAAARGHDPTLFGLALPHPIGRDRGLARAAFNVHEVIAWSMAALVAVHVAAAVWHHVIGRDTTLWRMLPRRRRVSPECSH